MAFPQTELEVDIYMEIPQGMEVEEGNGSQVLKLIKNLYGLKQASHNWYTMIKKGLEDRDFVPSEVDPCIYFERRYGSSSLCG